MVNIKELIEQGYRRTSRKYGLISRIDRPDWRTWMAQCHSPWDRNEGLNWVYALGDSAPDHYRRVYSKDTLELGQKKGLEVPISSFDTTEYLTKQNFKLTLEEFEERVKYLHYESKEDKDDKGSQWAWITPKGYVIPQGFMGHTGFLSFMLEGIDNLTENEIENHWVRVSSIIHAIGPKNLTPRQRIALCKHLYTYKSWFFKEGENYHPIYCDIPCTFAILEKKFVKIIHD